MKKVGTKVKALMFVLALLLVVNLVPTYAADQFGTEPARQDVIKRADLLDETVIIVNSVVMPYRPYRVWNCDGTSTVYAPARIFDLAYNGVGGYSWEPIKRQLTVAAKERKYQPNDAAVVPALLDKNLEKHTTARILCGAQVYLERELRYPNPTEKVGADGIVKNIGGTYMLDENGNRRTGKTFFGGDGLAIIDGEIWLPIENIVNMTASTLKRDPANVLANFTTESITEKDTAAPPVDYVFNKQTGYDYIQSDVNLDGVFIDDDFVDTLVAFDQGRQERILYGNQQIIIETAYLGVPLDVRNEHVKSYYYMKPYMTAIEYPWNYIVGNWLATWTVNESLTEQYGVGKVSSIMNISRMPDTTPGVDDRYEVRLSILDESGRHYQVIHRNVPYSHCVNALGFARVPDSVNKYKDVSIETVRNDFGPTATWGLNTLFYFNNKVFHGFYGNPENYFKVEYAKQLNPFTYEKVRRNFQ